MAQPSATHWRTVHRRMNEQLMFAEDIGGLGASPVDLEIVDSGVMIVKGSEDSKPMPWLAFAGEKKKLALNVTNCKAMQSLGGTGVVESWRGWVRLMVVSTTYRDQKTKDKVTPDAIRIAPSRPQPPRAVQPAAPSPVALELVAAYDACATAAELSGLKERRLAAWPALGHADKDLVVAAGKAATARLDTGPAPAAPPPAAPPGDVLAADEPPLTEAERRAIEMAELEGALHG